MSYYLCISRSSTELLVRASFVFVCVRYKKRERKEEREREREREREIDYPCVQIVLLQTIPHQQTPCR